MSIMRDAAHDRRETDVKLTELTQRTCAFCGDTFMPRHPKQIYDSTDCRYRQARQVAYEQRQRELAEQEALASVTNGAQ